MYIVFYSILTNKFSVFLSAFLTKTLDILLRRCYNIIVARTCGGIGRRAGLRIRCPRREGSSPFRCTTSHHAAVFRSLCFAKTSFLCRHGAPFPSEAVAPLAYSLVNALIAARCRFGLRTGLRLVNAPFNAYCSLWAFHEFCRHGAPFPSEAVAPLAYSLVNALIAARCRFGLRTGLRLVNAPFNAYCSLWAFHEFCRHGAPFLLQ